MKSNPKKKDDMNHQQMRVLMAPINPRRVKKLDGNSYVEQQDIRAMLIRLFGYDGWSLVQLHEPRLLFERERELNSGKPGITVGYLCSVAIIIHAPLDEQGFLSGKDQQFSGTATGSATMGINSIGDAHDSALKTADSGALKRAAINLGTQFGLSLYWDGTMNDTVIKAWDGKQFVTSSILDADDDLDDVDDALPSSLAEVNPERDRDE